MIEISYERNLFSKNYYRIKVVAVELTKKQYDIIKLSIRDIKSILNPKIRRELKVKPPLIKEKGQK